MDLLITKFNLNNNQANGIIVGAFNNKSYYGFKSKILKSGICKY